MLQINMADVVAVLNSIAPHLIVIGIVLALALIATLAINRKTMADEATRKLIHAESWLVFLVTVVTAVAMMLFGPLATLLNNATAERYMLSDQTVTAANDLAEEVQSEGITMLKNVDGNLPLADNRVNVFGWASTNPVYGGTGSGSMNATYPTVSVLQGMANAGLETNDELSQFYVDYREDRPVVGFWDPDWTLPEPPADTYGEDLLANARDFSDQAVIVITRVGGEMADLPTNMTGENVIYTDNSTEYADFEEGEHILQLSRSERDMVELVTSNFENVTLVYNGANAFELGFVDEYPQIKSVLWCPPAGQTGFTALGEILAGTVNPSGKTADTFVYDLTATPTWNNFGDFHYDNMDDYAVDYLDFRGVETHNTPTFVNYVEGIYVGYRFYETAADEGLIDYDTTVQYPFGYGLSYTTFEQEMGKVTYDEAAGTISFDVTVTNTGDVAGKDVIEVYADPPYVNGGIEKASANLMAFDKTDLLEPGASETISIEFDDDDLASYDSDNAKAYVLEAGDYVISINSDSHTVIDEQTITVPETITYDTEDNTHDGDQVVATNQFEYAEGDIEYLSRADHFANYDEATAAPATMSMPDEYKAMFLNNDNYVPEDHNNADDQMPTTGAENGLRLADLRGADYDDPRWEQLLDQLTFDEMDNLIAFGGYGNAAIDSIGKVALVDLDGPAALNNNFTGVGSIGFPASVAFACTWNVDLATSFGDMMGRMARELNATGWYAPSINNHRSAFAGRNFEYFSEDPVLAGVMASGEVAGAQAQGVYAFVKHFALNDQEANRQSMLCTWATEQSIREIYMKPFEITVKDGGTTAIMSAYNYIGPIYAGASENLLNTVLRDEWGYRGVVISDYFLGQGYQNADQMIRAGNDFMLATTDITNRITDDSATSLIAMRQATKNLLYTAVNSWMYENGEPQASTPIWQVGAYVGIGIAAVAFLGLEILTVKRYLARRKAKASTTTR